MFLVSRKYCIFSLTTSSCIFWGIAIRKYGLGLKANIKFYHKDICENRIGKIRLMEEDDRRHCVRGALYQVEI